MRNYQFLKEDCSTELDRREDVKVCLTAVAAVQQDCTENRRPDGAVTVRLATQGQTGSHL
jgi:hypothetical protein